MRREHFLLASEIQIQREEKFVPRSLMPAPLLILGSDSRGGVQSGACSNCGKVKVGAAVIISRCSLQCVTDSSGKSKKPDRWRWIFKETSQSQMHVNTREHRMIGDTVDNAAFPGFLLS